MSEPRLTCQHCPARFSTEWEREVHEKEHAHRSSNPGAAPDVDYALLLMGCWGRGEKSDGGPGGACRLAEQALIYQRAEIERLTEELDVHLKVHLGVVRENQRLRMIEATARELITTGMSLRFTSGPALSVIERADKSDPHYRLCKLMEQPDETIIKG